jgi:hypothetical protein
VKRVDPYTDFYVWHDGKIDPETGNRVEPSNWVSSVVRSSSPVWKMKVRYIVGFEVLTAATMKMAVLLVVAPCSLVEVRRRSRDTFDRPDDGSSKHL